MRRLFVAVMLLVCASVYAQTSVSIALTVGQWIIKSSKKVYYVQVESTAPTAEAARHAGFRKAVELAVGTVVLGESESDGKNLLRDDVVTYSSGFIEEFKVLTESTNGGRVTVKMDVWVSNSKIANRLTAVGVQRGARIEGTEMLKAWENEQAKQDSEAKRQRDGARLIHTVIRDYPQRAIQSTVQRTWLGKNNGLAAFFIEVEIKFSKEYIVALEEAVRRTRSRVFPRYHDDTGVSIQNGFFRADATKGYFPSTEIKHTIVNRLQTDVSMQITLLGNGAPWQSCWYNVKQELDGELFGWDYNKDYVIKADKTVTRIYILENTPRWGISDARFVEGVSRFDRVEAQVVDTVNCR